MRLYFLGLHDWQPAAGMSVYLAGGLVAPGNLDQGVLLEGCVSPHSLDQAQTEPGAEHRDRRDTLLQMVVGVVHRGLTAESSAVRRCSLDAAGSLIEAAQLCKHLHHVAYQLLHAILEQLPGGSSEGAARQQEKQPSWGEIAAGLKVVSSVHWIVLLVTGGEDAAAGVAALQERAVSAVLCGLESPPNGKLIPAAMAAFMQLRRHCLPLALDSLVHAPTFPVAPIAREQGVGLTGGLMAAAVCAAAKEEALLDLFVGYEPAQAARQSRCAGILLQRLGSQLLLSSFVASHRDLALVGMLGAYLETLRLLAAAHSPTTGRIGKGARAGAGVRVWRSLEDMACRLRSGEPGGERGIVAGTMEAGWAQGIWMLDWLCDVRSRPASFGVSRGGEATGGVAVVQICEVLKGLVQRVLATSVCADVAVHALVLGLVVWSV